MTAGLPVGIAAWLRVPVSFFLTILLLVSGGEASAALRFGRIDVAITSPVTRSSFSTTTATIALAGRARDRAGVVRVTWRNDRGGDGVAVGTEAWSVPNIQLSPGVNRILVTAYGRAGNLRRDILAVSYRPPAGAAAVPDTQAPGAPGGLGASAVSSSQINLSWAAATDNTGVTGYRIERCQGPGCASFAPIGTATGTTYSNTGLTGSTSYSYRVRATDAANNLGGYSAPAIATTAAGPAPPPVPDTQAPGAPGGLGASAVSSSQINLSWTAATDNTGVTGYRIERCQGPGCASFAPIGTATGTTYSNTGLIGSTSYSYRVRATDAANNLGGYSAPAMAATAAPANRPPVISGSSTTSVVAGAAYAFTPTASDPDGQTLRFSVMGAPAWAAFSTTTGRLSGTPGAGNVGLTEGIVITVGDGTAYASLPAFSLTVTQGTTGSALVSWLPPTQRTDGSALTNLAGYHIRYGTSAATLTQTISLDGAGLTSFMIQGLTTGKWYFSVTAFDAAGGESDLSNIGSKTIL